MNGRINNILEELYRLEPDFREQEDELMDIIKSILESRPDTQFSESFAQELRPQLLGRGAYTERRKTVFENIIYQIKHMNINYKFAAPIAAFALIAGAVLYTVNQGTGLYAPSTTVTQTAGRAFGSLLAQSEDGATAEESRAIDQAASQSVSSRSVAGFGGGGDGVESLIYPGPQNFKYTYVGDKFSLTDNTVNVLRRITGVQAGDTVSEHIKNLDFGVFNVGSFSSTKVENVNFSEDREFGYTVSINFTDGSISVHENWTKWPHPGQECRDQACFEKYRLRESDIPADSELINIAGTFLRERGISTQPYGEPFVDKQWRVYFDEGQTTELYVPDSIQVKYPIVVNNETVYEQGGDAAGLVLNVNIRVKRVSSLWGLTSQQYEASAYKAETDAGRMIQIAEAGGLYGYLLPARDALEIKLGTPERILMRQHNWHNGESQELLVPALSFPVVEAPEKASYWQKRPIIIPLASELLVRDGGLIPYPRVEPTEAESIEQEAVELEKVEISE